jgi:hypothetical protein
VPISLSSIWQSDKQIEIFTSGSETHRRALEYSNHEIAQSAQSAAMSDRYRFGPAKRALRICSVVPTLFTRPRVVAGRGVRTVPRQCTIAVGRRSELVRHRPALPRWWITRFELGSFGQAMPQGRLSPWWKSPRGIAFFSRRVPAPTAANPRADRTELRGGKRLTTMTQSHDCRHWSSLSTCRFASC